MIPSRLSIAATIVGMSLFATSAAARIVSSSSSSSEPMACTMEAKLCPDGETYVGRTGPNCEFETCPGASSAPSCEPYRCVDGTTHPSCTEDGHVINYFAPPCMTHGGDAGPFKDVGANHANANAIAYAKAEGIVEGYADGTFKPDAEINRAEFVKILMGSRDDDPKMCKIAPFPDIDQSAWYASDIHEARCDGLVGGYSDGTFRPATDINFAEAAKIIVKAFGLEASTTIPACETSDCPWYRDYVMILEAHAAIPVSIGSLDVKITRGEMAEMIWRLKAGVTDLQSKTYDELSGQRVVGAGCVIGGCSGEICSDAEGGPMMSNCMYVPAYQCYKTATCERQATGKCGWTETPSLRQCLADAQ